MPQFDDYDYRTQGNRSTELMNSIADVYGGAPIANVFTPGVQAIYQRAKEDALRNQQGRNAQNISTPTFDSDAAVQARYSGDFNPSLYDTPESAQYSLAQDSAEGRSAQLAALQQMAGLTDQSAGSSMALGRNQADMDARQVANSREGAIRQDAMRRGQLGGTADMLSRQSAAQAGANQNLNAGLQNAQQAALMQLAGTQAGASMAGQLRGQDQAMAFNNADTINRFNMANTNARNQANQANTQMRNAGNLRNLDAQQGWMDRSTGLGMAKLNRSDANKESGFGNQMSKYGAVNNVLEGKARATGEQEDRSLNASKAASQNFKDLMKMVGGGGGGMGE